MRTNTVITAFAISLLLAGGMVVSSAVPAFARTGCGNSVTVSSGDTLNRIAARCGTSISAILRLNPRIGNPNRIFAGQQIRLTGSGSVVVDEDRPTGGTYRVRPGDTLASIARRYGISLRSLIAANQLVNPNRIRIGIVLTLPGRGGGNDGGDRGARTLTLRGEITTEGVECLAMRDDRGRLYTLTGRVRNLEPGDYVEVRGVRAEVSFCQQGRTIDVARARVIAEGGGGGDPDEDFVTVRGVLTNEGVECQAMRSTDGRLITFAHIPGYEAGDLVEVSGTIADFSFCQQGTTINVEDISTYR
jgi:LysM repeat protein